MSRPLPYIIAEAAQGYEGNEKVVNLLIQAASAAGADAIKFQIVVADDSALPDYQHYQLFKTLELPWAVWEGAIEKARRLGLAFYMDALGTTAIERLSSRGVDGYKIHATNINNVKILKLVAATKKAVLLSTGGCERDEVDHALKRLEGCAITIMHGFQAEPTDLTDNHLQRITTLKETYGLPVGFQDHTAGDSEFAFLVPFIAMGAGATLIEKHLTLSRAAKMEDYVSALNAEEFARWVTMVRQIAPVLGNKEWMLTEKEREYRKKVKRAVCSAEDISAGQTIHEEMLVFKRTNQQDVLYELAEVVGKKAKRAINKNMLIRSVDIL